MDTNTFNELKRIAKRIISTKKGLNDKPAFALPCPLEITIQLTHKCNLRCAHCFQWNSKGHHLDNQSEELDVGVLSRIFEETQTYLPAVYLWGGEPLVYNKWEDLIGLLNKYQNKIIISTNGVLLKQKIEPLLPISKNVEVIISLDGLEYDNDKQRGKGSFSKTVENIRFLTDLRKKGIFQGFIIINNSLHNDLIPNLYNFVKFCDSLECDRIILGYPWYIPDERVIEMDSYFKTYFNYLDLPSKKASWCSFSHKLNNSVVPQLIEQINKINMQEWNTRVGYHPPMGGEANEVKNIINAIERPYNREQHCSALSSRVSVFADGRVSMCANFPEFTFGNIYEKSLLEIWQNSEFKRAREIRNQHLMSPMLCQRCRLLSYNIQ